MKKYYKVKLFCSIAFCILTAIAVLCAIFLFCYIFGVRIPIELDNATCENINMTLVSLTTGYIVSYITYLLSAHIPNYNREIKNEKLLRENYLWNYKNELVCSFSLLKHLYKEHDELQLFLSSIPEINDFFNDDCQFVGYNKLLIKELDVESSSYLFNKFKKLENAAQILLAVSRSCSCSLSDKINQLLTPIWFKFFEVIYGELKNLWKVENNNVSQEKLNQYNFLREQSMDYVVKMKDYIVKNFELCREV